MNAESCGDVNALDHSQRLFRVHVGAVVLTAALVVPLLLGIASIPSWVSITSCVLLATVAIGFAAVAIRSLFLDHGVRVANRLEFLVVTVALSVIQAIFILPVLICVFTPTLRL